LLAEADLIQLMDRHGIGTDATIAAHIETIQTRNYATRSGNGGRFLLRM
jgi:DNA topoisomerase-3